MEDFLFWVVVPAVAGGLLSWLITRHYYRKSSIDVPEWAKPILRSLPQNPPSKEKLLELFQDALQRGDVAPDPVLGHVAGSGSRCLSRVSRTFQRVSPYHVRRRRPHDCCGHMPSLWLE